MSSQSVSSLLCPNCKAPLQMVPCHDSAQDNMMCQTCGLSFPLKDDILDLRVSRKDYYFNPVPPSEMRELTQSMWDEGWPRTIRRFLRSVNNKKDWLDNLVADGRYAWKLFLPLTSDTVLLDLGCGLGNLTANLVAHVGKVYAMDLTYARLEFARQRMQPLNDREKVTFLAGGDGPYLPFPDCSLDCVVLSGVLEWVGEGGFSWNATSHKFLKALHMVKSPFGAASPRNVQRAFLKEIVRVLKPDGTLFIGIENRLNYEYFLGRPDHHSGLLGGSLLPRVAANLYSIAKNYRPYRTYTYSFNGYKKLLKAEGLAHVKALGLSPGYSNLRKIIPLERRWESWNSIPKSFKESVKDHRHFVPAFGILASSQPTTSNAILTNIIRNIEDELSSKLGKGDISLSRFYLTNKEKGIAYGMYDTTPLVIKFPFASKDEQGEQRNLELLRLAQQNRWNHLLKCPIPLVQGMVNKQAFFVEQRQEGGLVFYQDWSSMQRLYRPIRQLLVEWSERLPLQKRLLSGEWYQSQVTDFVEKLRLSLSGEEVSKKIQSYFDERLQGAEIVYGLRHGDLSVSNIFDGGQHISGIVDWEQYELEGLSFFNALDFLFSANRRGYGSASTEDVLRQVLDRKFASAEEQEFYDDCCQHWHVGAEIQEAILFLYWIQYISGQMANGLEYDEERLSMAILPMLQELTVR